MSNPSATELIILKALWSHKRLTAREVHTQCAAQLEWSFSSTRTTLMRMIEKNLVTTEKVHGVTVYLPVQTKVKIMANLMQDFMSRVFEVKGPLPTSAFAQSELLSEDEWQEIKDILEADEDD
jgi:predicted transcriptional regulator